MDCTIGLEESVRERSRSGGLLSCQRQTRWRALASLCGPTVLYVDDVNEEEAEEAMVVEWSLERESVPTSKKITILPPTTYFSFEDLQKVLECSPNLDSLSTERDPHTFVWTTLSCLILIGLVQRSRSSTSLWQGMPFLRRGTTSQHRGSVRAPQDVELGKAL